MSVQIVEGPGYYADGKGGIVLRGEYSRTCPIECNMCGLVRKFRLCTDDIVSDDECDRLLDAHIRKLGWSTDGAGDEFGDRCPDCVRRSM